MSNDEHTEQASEGISATGATVGASTADGTREESNETQEVSNQEIHQQTRSGDIVSPVGNNARVTINHFYGIVRYVEKRASHTNDDEETIADINGSEDDFIKENLLFARQNISRFDDSSPKTRPGSSEPPLEEEKLSTWYYGLDEYEQCYVQSVAILHGAATRDIYKGADTFYRIIQVQKHTLLEPLTTQQQTVSEVISREHQTFTFPRKPRLTLQEHTHTVPRRVKGTECLFWQDVDPLGQSPFESRVLSFLAKEFISKGEHWEHFLKMIEFWCSKRGGSSWRAARALGVILWHQDVDQLRKQVDVWAKKGTFSGQALAASLLDAAREIELFSQQGEVGYAQESPVLELLREWTEKVQTDLNKTNISVGCATAKAYSLVGKRSLDTDAALHGVENLLKLQQRKEINEIRSLFAAVVSTYVNLTWSGHLRKVLRYLANAAEKLVHYWELPETLEERRQHRPQREIRLKMTFEAFFLVTAATSPPEERKYSQELYVQALAEQITIPDPSGRNVLLAAILTGDIMSDSIRTLLCAAIVSINNVQESRLAFELIRRWVETIIAFQGMSPATVSPLYDTFVQFLAELGRMIARWCSDLAERGYRTPGASDIYKHKFEQWHDEGAAYQGAIGALAHEVLVQLSVN